MDSVGCVYMLFFYMYVQQQCSKKRGLCIGKGQRKMEKVEKRTGEGKLYNWVLIKNFKGCFVYQDFMALLSKLIKVVFGVASEEQKYVTINSFSKINFPDHSM